jgi:hypothetical protein
VEHPIAGDILEQHNGHVRNGIHHQPANFHLNFHKNLKSNRWSAEQWSAGRPRPAEPGKAPR